MREFAAEPLVQRLIDWGVDTVFGRPVKVIVADSSMSASFALWADACGALGLRVEHAGELERAVGLALEHPGPALVDVLVNPAERPQPADRVTGGR